MMAEDNGVLELRLGASFDSNPRVAFHSVRYDFKPASVDVTKEATLEVGEKSQVTVTVPHIEGSGTTHTVYKGNKRTCPKECVLIIDNVTGSVTLEKLSNTIQVKKIRAEGSSRLSMRPLTPVDTSKLKTSPPKGGKVSQLSPAPFKECSPALTPIEQDNNRENVNGVANVVGPTPLTEVSGVETGTMSDTSSSSSSSSGSSISSDSDSDNSDSDGEANKNPPTADVPNKDLCTLSEDLHLSESGSDNPPTADVPNKDLCTLSEDLHLSESGSDNPPTADVPNKDLCTLSEDLHLSESGSDNPPTADVPNKDLCTLSEDLHLSESGSDSE